MSENQLYADETTLMHVWGPCQWHDSSYIVANRAALLKLRKAVDDALEKGHGFVDAFAGDGEGFSLLIARAESKEFDVGLALPYTDEIAARNDPETQKLPWAMEEIKEAQKECQSYLEAKYPKP